MTQTAIKVQKQVHILGRAQFKANGFVLYRVQSGEKRYDVTVASGRVTSCVDQNGNNCKGWQYRRSCHHADLVTAKEAERVEAEELRFSPWHGSNYGAERPIEERGTLNHTSRGFSLLR
jgi:hypothetical protein